MLATLFDLLKYIKARKKFWLAPLILALIILSLIIIFAEGSALAPLIYTFF